MTVVPNPAIETFVTHIVNELKLAQVLIRRCDSGFELRQVDDRSAAASSLRTLCASDLRGLAQFTAGGAFRPLKAAPNLPGGWRVELADAAALEFALNQLYPGAIADWHAAHQTRPPVTDFREFTGRQTGMYRITALLSDAQAAQVIRAACHRRFCLKRRLWSVEGLPSDRAEEKSAIPCLEPCAIFLEFARQSMRIEQQEKVHAELAPADAAVLMASLRDALDHPRPDVREGEFSSADNPRRIQLALEKLKTTSNLASVSDDA